MISIFFSKKNLNFFITTVFFNQTAVELSLYLFSTIFSNLLQAFFYTLDVRNCMISIFSVWRSNWDSTSVRHPRKNEINKT